MVALDLWEIADHFGENRAITPTDYRNYFGRGKEPASVRRAWERLLSRIRSGPFPVEFVTVPSDHGFDHCEGRQLALMLHRGTRTTTAKILDNNAGVSYDDVDV